MQFDGKGARFARPYLSLIGSTRIMLSVMESLRRERGSGAIIIQTLYITFACARAGYVDVQAPVLPPMLGRGHILQHHNLPKNSRKASVHA